MKKRIFSLFIVAILAAVFSNPAFAKSEIDNNLQFNENHEFKILNLCDCQDIYPAQEAMVEFIREVLDKVQPDLVVFGGDNVVTSDVRAFDEIFNPLVERGIPFTFVFGNHDDECSDLNKEEILAHCQKYDGCLAYDAVPELHGCATHNLTILSSDGSKVAFNLWLFDSGDYCTADDGSKYYDCVREDQLEWYKKTSTALEESNGGKVPSIAFQHIIVEEVMEGFFYKSPFNLGKLSKNFLDGTSYTYIPKLTDYEGIFFEIPCPSLDNAGEWDAFVERGDVLACVTGHDHINNFITTVDGIDIVQSPSCSYKSYNKDFMRGARLITLNETNPWHYDTEVISSCDIALQDGSSLPGLSGKTKADYIFSDILGKILNYSLNALRFFLIKM
jgi:predicted MPP superfamily phosphohydrolase